MTDKIERKLKMKKNEIWTLRSNFELADSDSDLSYCLPLNNETILREA